MRIYNGVSEDMVTTFVDMLPKYCPYCRGRCWQIDNYLYACRCFQCSAYFHREFKTCVDLECEGYDTHLCTRQHSLPALRLFELEDGTLVEVCQGCFEWLYEEGFINEYIDSISRAFNDFNISI